MLLILYLGLWHSAPKVEIHANFLDPDEYWKDD